MDRQQLIQQLILHEGIRAQPYLDTVGKVTIGVGRNLTDRGLRHDEILVLLNNDIDECLADCRTFPWFDALDDVRQRVVLDLRFNLGPTKLRDFTNTLAAIAAQHFPLAAQHLLASRWATQVKSRATRLAHMLETGTDEIPVR